MFKRGDIIETLEEFQDSGDNTFTWMVLHDEEKGRVDITPIDTIPGLQRLAFTPYPTPRHTN